jgi:alkanesulfonate monooxygenase SsuD/methylene tetrahydromethanopterin reductase-like flavin-dependent oxidoreductase (luciferase family)
MVADREAQRQRLMPRGLQESIDVGQIVLGSPDTVVRQVETIQRELGAGIIDFTIAHDMGDKTLHAIELLGTKVLPRMRQLVS